MKGIHHDALESMSYIWGMTSLYSDIKGEWIFALFLMEWKICKIHYLDDLIPCLDLLGIGTKGDDFPLNKTCGILFSLKTQLSTTGSDNQHHVIYRYILMKSLQGYKCILQGYQYIFCEPNPVDTKILTGVTNGN